MSATKPLAKLKDLATRAGRWLGLAATPAPTLHTQAVGFDRFDEMGWKETYGQAPALGELADELADRHSYTTDLLRDMWTAAYKAAPQMRDRTHMDPSRMVNHQVVSALMESPEFRDLHRNTVGDPYAAAMAVLAQGTALRGTLEHTRKAREAEHAATEARQQAAQAAQAVQAAMEEAEASADDDGHVPDDVGDQAAAAIAAAEAAEAAAGQADADARRALAQAAPGIRAAARAAAAKAAEEAQAEADLMSGWGIDPGRLERMSFEERSQLAQRLAGNRMAAFAKLIGRFRTMAAGERARKMEHTAGELVGITLGDDLSRLVPSELVALAVPVLRGEFAVRLAEGRLMMYDSRDEEQAGQGAIIACVDCSYSMAEEEAAGISREAWAKACTLALLDQARASGRDFVGILFSSSGQQKAFHFPKGRADISALLEMGEHFFGGGTDFQEPLDLAADVLAEQYNADGTQRGDIVLITDGDCHVAPDWMEQWRQRKTTLGYRVFGVSVAFHPGQVLEELCDNLRSVTDLVDLDGSRDLFRLI
ncbi:VWA domain-containing protein [Nonomuraea sp. NPDC052265]|uniref:VWA domain-containing protein n=1 Tax=Nonomuraea sp. NPDC052265 TaxID=3364374 RepID=UPI0037C93F8E